MVRRTSFLVCLAVLFGIGAIGGWSGAPGAATVAIEQSSSRMPAAPSGPIRLARHPDYHAGKIAFSYLGDIWTANENGADAHRITDHSARDVYPRFAPDGRWIAFSSNRYGGYDVFLMPATGGAADPWWPGSWPRVDAWLPTVPAGRSPNLVPPL